jgi:hypothetical protein
MPIIANIIATYVRRFIGGLPKCVRDLAVAWYKDLNARNKTCEATAELQVIDFKATIDDNEYVSFSTLPNLDQKITATFKMYLDKESGYSTATGAGQTLFAFYNPTGTDRFIGCGLNGSNFIAYSDIALGGYITVPLINYGNQVVEVEIIKELDGSFYDITSVKFNGVSQTLTDGTPFSTTTQRSYVGAWDISANNTTLLSDATIWDLKLYDASDVLIHHWAGYGSDANLDSAWVDQIGNIDGTVSGTPDLRGSGETILETYYCIDDKIGTREDTVFFGQYLSSGTIDFHRSVTVDYIDPSTGNLVEGVAASNTLAVPANGICDIGVYPREGETTVNGVLAFDGVDDRVVLGGSGTGPDPTGSKTLTLKLYLTSIPASDVIVCHFNTGAVNDLLSLHINNSGYLVVSRSGTTATDGRMVDISSNLNRELDISISKSLGVIDTILINGVDNSIAATSFTPYNGTVAYIGAATAGNYILDAFIWDININNTNTYSGQPDGNLDSAWVDTTGVIDGTVQGSPTTTDLINIIGSNDDIGYTSFHPCCERAGTVLHDINENSIHISVTTPVWDETLYGTDYLNQYGYVDKADNDTEGYTWETSVNGSPVTLDDNTLIPLKKNINLSSNTLDGAINMII